MAASRADRSKGRSGSNTLVIGSSAALLLLVVVFGAIAFTSRGCAAASAGAPARPVASAPTTAAAPASGARRSAPASPTAASGRPAASVNASAAATPKNRQWVPVLMYHHVMPHPNNNIAVTPEAFEKEMAWLEDNGYHPVSIAQFTAFEQTGAKLPDKPVLITLDDGRMNQLTYAVPILRKHGFTATFFVVKKWVDSSSSSFMHADELRKLADEGFDVESHTADHIMMRRLKTPSGAWETYEQQKARLWYTTNGMRLWLTEITGKPVTALAYPGGAYNTFSARLLADAGYTTAFTCDSGLNAYKDPAPMFVRRYEPGVRDFSWGSWLAIFKHKPKP